MSTSVESSGAARERDTAPPGGEVGTPPPGSPGGTGRGADTARRRRPAAPGPPVLSLRDLLLPVGVAVTLVVLYSYVRGQDLDRIETNLLRPSALLDQTWGHIYISVTIAVLVVAIAVPLGVLVTRERTSASAPVVLALANIGQAAPSLGLIALIGTWKIGFWAVVLVLTGYAILSVLRNTIAGLQGVDRGVLDAAKGMGMSPAAVLLKVELPLAVPIIGAGARTALILAVATVPLGSFLDAGGLGLSLFGAIKTDRPVATLTIAVIIACLALVLDWLAGILQRLATPRGIR
ncbi:ABC transporter permease [Nocardioides panaciterrulae]|uniref:ABC-type proline/glycine betaine transport system permease subunit n=1 Tax=Nocardioides panaciterrulae TaxID=661492 RepID=A0A7Y9E874_9ACTN|nr:ABC transporter permease [Nocardioides panaciterrulae]NYD42929.1 ABC-type proline/glycine betaine transport system permease subunit [Nocardioides panaciterrulae]